MQTSEFILIIERDEKVINALKTLLESNVGYEIVFYGGMLALYQLEDGRFVVNRKDWVKDIGDQYFYEETFENAREAVEFFELKRREHEFGFDIEGALYREEQKHSEK